MSRTGPEAGRRVSRTCPACGASPDGPFARFCSSCGQPVGDGVVAPTTDHAVRPAVVLGAALGLAVLVAIVAITARTLTAPEPAEEPAAPALSPLGAIHWTASSVGMPDRPLVTDLAVVAAPTGGDRGGPATATDEEDGLALATTGETLWGLDLPSGAVRWERRLAGGTTIPPTIAGDAAVVTRATSPGSREVVAVDLATGTTRWALDVEARDVVGTPSLALVADDEGALHAVDAASGARRWSRAGGGTVVDADDRDVLVLRRDGDRRVLEALAAADGSARWTAPVRGHAREVRATATLADASTVVLGDGDGSIHGLDRATGERAWSADTVRRGDTLAPTPGGLVVVVDEVRRYTALDVRSGTRVWSNDRLVLSPEQFHVGTTEAVSVTADRQVAGIGLADGATLWEARLPPVGEVAVGGRLVVQSDGDGRLVGARTLDRTTTWRTWLPPEGRGGLVTDGRIILRGATPRTNLAAYAPRTGAVRWSQRVGTGVTTAPAAAEGRLVLRRALSRPHPYRDRGIVITALETDEGTVLWEVPTADEHTPTRLPSTPPTSLRWRPTVPPAIDGEIVIEVARTTVRAYAAADGALRWEAHLPDVVRVPAAIGPEAVIVVDAGGRVTAFDRASGVPRWEAPVAGTPPGPPRIAGDTAFVPTVEGTVHALDLASGHERWRAEIGAALRAGPVVVAGVVVVATDEVVALRVDDGAEVWRHAPSGPPVGAPTPTDPLRLATTDGEIVALAAEDGAVVGRFLVPDAIGAAPVVVGDRTYVLTLPGEIHAVGPRTGEQAEWPLPPIERRG